MNIRFKVKHCKIKLLILFLAVIENGCYEKTLRKIVRNQSKMVQKPFSDSNDFRWNNYTQSHAYIYPGYAQINSIVHKMQRPKMSTILSSVDTGRSKALFSRMNIAKNEILRPMELRMARDALANVLSHNDDNTILTVSSSHNTSGLENVLPKSTYSIPASIFFPSVDNKHTQIMEIDTLIKENGVISDNSKIIGNNSLIIKSVPDSKTDEEDTIKKETNENAYTAHNLTTSEYYVTDPEIEYIINKPFTISTFDNNNSLNLLTCNEFNEAKVDIDAQEKFMEFDIEPPWTVNKQFWNQNYEIRYDTLMRNQNWPPLKVILVPRAQVDSIWKQPFDNLHKKSVRKIISNIVKKLQFYSNLTFSWNEVSHLSQWWKGARQKSRLALRRLVEEGRLEITTGGWVETDEATSHIFGILHQLIEGHQWLQYHLNYAPDVAWLTNSVTHSPTLPYILSASGITKLVITNLHFSWQQYLTEYQYTDFIWTQRWDTDKTARTDLNEALNRIGNNKYPKHSVLTHYLQFNSAGFKACGPQSIICDPEFNFAHSSNNQDINTFNVKEKSEKLLEQYSKTGTTSQHNVIISPLGGQYRYESQTEFDFQYNNYQKIADYVNINHNIYKATIQIGTTNDYFKNILLKQNSFPILEGDFLNFADIDDGSSAYWTGFFTTRPQFKMLLRRLQSTLRSTEILFSFALNFDVFQSYKVSNLYELLLNARESVARLQDRNVVGGTLTTKAQRYAQQEILNTIRDCWHIQETAASLLSAKSAQNMKYLKKYLYRDGEFVSSFKSVTPGDQIYVFNSLSHERSEVVEVLTRSTNLRIVDHNEKEIPIQINPIWKFGFEKIIRISSQFFKITFVIDIAPLTLVLFKIEESHEGSPVVATIYCNSCLVDELEGGHVIPFNVRTLEPGDIQLESHKHRLVFDEYTGFLKSVTQKWNNIEKPVVIEFGAFKSANVHSGMFLFNTNITSPLEDILSPFRQNSQSKAIIIVSGHISTELSSIYGSLLQHTVKIFNNLNSPISDVIKLETKVDYDGVPKNREMEMFMSIQTDIGNGNPPEFFIDNNGFQYTGRRINVSRRIESNLYPFTSISYLQDQQTRLTIITDYAQGITVLQEGQLTLMLDRRVLFDDNRGSNEGITDYSPALHTHYLLLETFVEPRNSYDEVLSRSNLKLPSSTALYLANTLNYHLDIFFINTNKSHLCHFAYKPLIKTPFPCEVTLINYRAVLNRGTPEIYTPNTALMTLHKQNSCCRLLGVNIHCNKSDNPLKLANIFRKVKAVYQTNLVGTSEGVTVTVLNKNNFPPMQLITMRVYF